jgi:hypothetical protein
LADGASDTGEHLLRIRSTPCAVAATDSSRNDNDRFILPVSVTLARFTTPGTRSSGSASLSSTRTTVAGSSVAICEMPDGSRAVVPVWMLDRVACATLSVGPHGARSLPSAICDLYLTRWGFMVVLPRTYASGRRLRESCKSASCASSRGRSNRSPMLRNAAIPSPYARSASFSRLASRSSLPRSNPIVARIRFAPAASANSAARDNSSSARSVCFRAAAIEARRTVSSA